MLGLANAVVCGQKATAIASGIVIALYQLDTDLIDSSGYNRVLSAFGDYSFLNNAFKCNAASAWFQVPFTTELQGKSYTLEFRVLENFNYNAGNYHFELGGGIFDFVRTYVNSSTCSITASITAFMTSSVYDTQASYTQNWNTQTNLFVRFAYDHIAGTYKLYLNGTLVWTTSHAILSLDAGEPVVAKTFPSATLLAFSVSNAGAALDCIRVVKDVALGAGMPTLPLTTTP